MSLQLVLGDIPEPASIEDAAMIIARMSGLELVWLVEDKPWHSKTVQLDKNMIVGQALSALAAEVGAVLEWHGSNSYKVVYRNTKDGICL